MLQRVLCSVRFADAPAEDHERPPLHGPVPLRHAAPHLRRGVVRCPRVDGDVCCDGCLHKNSKKGHTDREVRTHLLIPSISETIFVLARNA